MARPHLSTITVDSPLLNARGAVSAAKAQTVQKCPVQKSQLSAVPETMKVARKLSSCCHIIKGK